MVSSQHIRSIGELQCVSNIPRTLEARGVSVVTESDYGVGVVYFGLKDAAQSKKNKQEYLRSYRKPSGRIGSDPTQHPLCLLPPPPQSSCDPLPNHSESISHTVSVPLQTTLATLEEIAC